jgi:alkyldihydroxyacetonephosphate synthase
VTGSRVPTPPLVFTGDPQAVTSRLGAEVPVDDDVVGRLGNVCASVDTSAAALVEAGRDWWPVTVGWGVGGQVPALPAAVARPASATEVASVLAVCADAGVPVTAGAGRSGVCGGAVPVFGGVALDLTGLAGIADVDEWSLTADVAAGTFGDRLEAELGDRWSMTLGHWPQSVAISTVGGWLACRSAGQYSTRYGKIEDMVVGLEVALADGSVVRTGGRAPRAATGPDLTALFVGSEGTLGVITEARLRVRPRPAAERRAAYAFRDFTMGLDACRRVLRRGATPAVLRLYDGAESQRAVGLADGCGLVVVDEGDPELVAATMTVVAEECVTADPLGEAPATRWLEHRNQVPSLADLYRDGIVADTVEVAASWRALPAIYQDAIAGLTAIGSTLAASAHQSHAYTDGACLYFTFAGQPEPGDADAYYREAWEAVMAATTARGGAISHHHGVGLNRGRFMASALGTAFDVLVAVKTALDPRGILNPGKLGLPSPFGNPPWP